MSRKTTVGVRDCELHYSIQNTNKLQNTKNISKLSTMMVACAKKNSKIDRYLMQVHSQGS